LIILGLFDFAQLLLVALETRAFIGVITVHHLPYDLQVVETDSFVNSFGGHGAFSIDFKLFVILVLWADHDLVCLVAHFLHKDLVIFCLFTLIASFFCSMKSLRDWSSYRFNSVFLAISVLFSPPFF